MSNLLIDADKQIAIKIAARFLEQHHSVTAYHASFQGDYWLVTARVGLFPEQIRKVRIDAKNGKIIDYT